MSEHPFQKVRRQLDAIDIEVRDVRKWAAEFVKQRISEGDYEGATQVGQSLAYRLEELLRHRADMRRLMPPFMTEENGFFRSHPVTPENKHLLWESAAAASLSKGGSRK